MIRVWRMAAIMAAWAIGLLAQQAGKPNFSGSWQLDPLRTRFGNIPQPQSLVIQIEHQEPKIRIVTITTTASGEAREMLELVTDGKPRTLTIEGHPCTATARWDWWSGTRLTVEAQREGPQGRLFHSRRFTLSPKGAYLTTILTVKDKSGEKKAYEFSVKPGA